MLAVIFRVSGASYAIPCLRIIEVVPLMTLELVPHAPPGLIGALFHRGRLTPVLDLSQLIGGYPCPSLLSSRVVLVDCDLPGIGTIRTGLLGEHVTETRHLKAAPVPGVPLAATPYLGDVVVEDGTSLRMLNVEHILLGSGFALAEHFSHGRFTTGAQDREAAKP